VRPCRLIGELKKRLGSCGAPTPRRLVIRTAEEEKGIEKVPGILLGEGRCEQLYNIIESGLDLPFRQRKLHRELLLEGRGVMRVSACSKRCKSGVREKKKKRESSVMVVRELGRKDTKIAACAVRKKKSYQKNDDEI